MEDRTALIKQKSSWLTLWLCISILHGLIGVLIMGYNIPIFNIAHETVRSKASQTYINDFQWGIINAGYPFGALFGALSSGKLCDKYGRKTMILSMDIIHIISSLIVSSSYYYIQLLFGRFLTGIGSGIATVVCSTYIKEISPPAYRGRLGALIQLSITFTICISMTLGRLYQTDPYFRYGVIVPGIISIIQLILYFTILESPEWLRQKDKESEAINIESKLWTQIYHSFEDTQQNKSSNKLHISDSIDEQFISTSITYKHILFCSLCLHLLTQLSGINAVFYYSEQILSETEDATDMDSWLGSVYISIANMLSSIIVLFFVDKYGRKPLLLISSIGMCIASIIITFMFMIETDIGVIICLICFVVFFEIGLGPIPFFYVAELSPIKYRADIMSYSLCVNWSCNTVIAFITPILVNGLDMFVFIPFGIVTFIATIFVYFILPETKHIK
eukprot:193239_1